MAMVCYSSNVIITLLTDDYWLLCMDKVIGGYSWLWVVIDGYTWLYMVIDGYGWLYMVIGGYTWL